MSQRQRGVADLIERIVLWAAVIAGICFAAGFFGPMFLSTSNLGPLIGIFVTGPLGALLGLLVGALSVAKHFARASIVTIGIVWALTLATTWLAMALASLAVLTIPFQILALASTLYLFLGHTTRAQLWDDLQRFWPVPVAAQALILLMTLFPPAVRNPYVPADKAREPVPDFAFFLDPRFSASRNAPVMNPNRLELGLEWIVAIAVAVGLFLIMRALRRRSTI